MSVPAFPCGALADSRIRENSEANVTEFVRIRLRFGELRNSQEFRYSDQLFGDICMAAGVPAPAMLRRMSVSA